MTPELYVRSLCVPGVPVVDGSVDVPPKVPASADVDFAPVNYGEDVADAR
jgi:hypothetical protein